METTIEYIPVDRLKIQNPHHFRESNCEAIYQSILEHGFDETKPIIVDARNDGVIDGKHRTVAARRAGLVFVPVILSRRHMIDSEPLNPA